jgi:imidazolonepropionase-like amidohydrolase
VVGRCAPTVAVALLAAVAILCIPLRGVAPANAADLPAAPDTPAPAPSIIAFTNARVLPVIGPNLDRGTIIIRDGRIAAIGPAADVPVPDGATIIDATGKTIIPGMVDTHSHVGGVAGADRSGPIQPDCRILDSINPRDSGFRRVVAGGITAMNIMPGSGHLLSGQTLYAKPRRPGNDTPQRIDDLFILDDKGQPMWGVKMANGTNSLGDAPFSGTRAKSAALVRERFIKAREYKAKLDAARAPDGTLDPAKVPARDLALEPLVEILDGTRIVHHHTHRADDIATVLRLRDEFGFRVVLHHTSEAWKIPDQIAKAGVPCSIILVDSPGGKLEAAELQWETGAILERAGVPVSIHSDDWINDCRLFLRSGALAVRAGMTREGALAALTIQGARQMDLESRIGSLEVGKDADLVVLSGDPFSTYTHVLETWIEGVRVYDRTNPDDRLYAVGGLGAGKDQAIYLCCAQDGFWFAGKQWGSGSTGSTSSTGGAQ